MELLAPSGSIAALKCAVHNGADAVYFGLGELNARSKCLDFVCSNLSEWVDYCHLYGVKVYVTVNTSVKQSEVGRVKELITQIDKAKADAVIACDPAVIETVKTYTDMPLHVSTQGGVHNLPSALFYKALGADRVILSRECRLDDMAAIKASGLEVEVFVQGALCISMSGGCLMSAAASSLSGNRGRCLQLCRRLYTCEENGAKGYLLSAKDMCLIRRLKQLRQVGVASIKIEGRNRRAEYSGITVASYRKALDNELSVTELERIDRELVKVFYRGYTEGYDKDRFTVNPLCQNHIGLEIGKVAKIEVIKGFCNAYVKSSFPIQKGDGLKIMRDNREVGGSDVTSSVFVDGLYKVPVSNGVKVGDEVRITTDSAQNAQVLKNVKTLDVDMRLYADNGNARLDCTCRGVTVSSAVNAPKTDNPSFLDRAKSQLVKCGGTAFSCRTLETDDSFELKNSELNALRRDALDKLRFELISGYVRKKAVNTLTNDVKTTERKGIDEIYITDSAEKAARLNGRNAYFVALIKDINNIRAEVAEYNRYNITPYLMLPRLARVQDLEVLRNYVQTDKPKLYADNNYVVELAREYGLSYIAGIGLNVYNSVSLEYYRDADAVVLSPEIGVGYFANQGCFVFAEGYLPLMTFAHCPHRTVTQTDCGSCKERCKPLTYTDESGRAFALRGIRLKNECQFTLYNYMPTVIKQTEGYGKLTSLIGVKDVKELTAVKHNSGFADKEVL